MNNNVLLKMEPMELLNYLTENYIKEIPTSAETIEELKAVNKRMNELTNTRSYLMPLLCSADTELRIAKAKKTDKEVVADLTSRREVFKTIIDVIDNQISSLSRTITVRKQIFEELRIS